MFEGIIARPQTRWESNIGLNTWHAQITCRVSIYKTEYVIFLNISPGCGDNVKGKRGQCHLTDHEETAAFQCVHASAD